MVGEFSGEAKPSDRRKTWLAVLARAPAEELASFWNGFDHKPTIEELRAPEIGLVMARGRMGGTGNPFNFGELTVTRASVRLENGLIGHGYCLGRDRDKARLIAIMDALLQDKAQFDVIASSLIEPLRRQQDEENRQRAERAAATKVDFTTVARETS